MNIGFYAGSFDPFTNGHLHVVRRASALFDKVIVAIGVHPDKKRRFDRESMQNAMEAVFRRMGCDNVTVISYSGLTVDAAEEHGATCFVRGIRNGMDYEYEENLASVNEELSSLDTVYIRSGRLGNISSSMVTELLRYGHSVSNYLPEEIIDVVVGG